MCTLEDVRRIALALPETYERPHRRAPSFWVNERIFCMLPKGDAQDRVSMWGDAPVVIKLEREDQLNMIEAHPDIVSPAGLYNHPGRAHSPPAPAEDPFIRLLPRPAGAPVGPRRGFKKHGGD